MAAILPFPRHDRLALLGGLEKASADQPHGARHSAYAVSRGLAASGRFREVTLYRDGVRGGRDAVDETERALAAEVGLPAGVALRIRDAASLPAGEDEYQAIYLLGSAVGRGLSASLRPLHDLAPLILELDLAHSPAQWVQLLAMGLSGALRPSDGFAVKSAAAAGLLATIWDDWRERFGLAAAPACRVVPNAVDARALTRDPALGTRVRAELGIAPGAPLFLAYSRLSPHTKGDQRALIVLFREVLARAPEASLVISGAETDRAYSEELVTVAREAGVAGQVRILPNPFALWPDARAALFSAADVFLHLTTGVEEVQPLVVLEAMAFGLPVVASRWAGLPEVITDGHDGLLIDTFFSDPPDEIRQSFGAGDPVLHHGAVSRSAACHGRQVVAAAVALAGAAQRRAEIGGNARRTVLARFTLDVAVAARLAFVDERAAAAEKDWDPDAEDGFSPLVDVAAVLAAQSRRRLTAGDRLVRAHPEAIAGLAEFRPATTARLARELLAAIATGGTTVGEASRQAAGALWPEAVDEQGTIDTDAALWCERLLLRLVSHGAVEIAGADSRSPE